MLVMWSWLVDVSVSPVEQEARMQVRTLGALRHTVRPRGNHAGLENMPRITKGIRSVPRLR